MARGHRVMCGFGPMACLPGIPMDGPGRLFLSPLYGKRALRVPLDPGRIQCMQTLRKGAGFAVRAFYGEGLS